jgi:hypothetical protein
LVDIQQQFDAAFQSASQVETEARALEQRISQIAGAKPQGSLISAMKPQTFAKSS